MKAQTVDPQDAINVRRFKRNQWYRNRREAMGHTPRKAMTSDDCKATMRPIVEAACRLTCVEPEMVYGRSQVAKLMFTRRIIMAAGRELGFSHSVIAFGIGRRCHTSVVMVMRSYNPDNVAFGMTGRQAVSKIVKDVSGRLGGINTGQI